jgi:hypothetical protein
MASKYDNHSSVRCARTGGSITVAIPGTPFQVQANGGTSLPCRGCWVSPRSGNTGITKMNIGAAASATLGIELSDADNGSGPLWVNISDVSQLYFYGATEGNDVDITYLVG